MAQRAAEIAQRRAIFATASDIITAAYVPSSNRCLSSSSA
jgi:hypothetical protein